MKSENIPGWLYLVAIALISQWSSELLVMGGKHPLEASAVAVVLGIIARNTGIFPDSCKAGAASSDKLLVLGIVLLGAGLDFNAVLAQGTSILSIIIVTMALSFFLIFFLGKLFKLSENLSLLLAAGTTICGTSAIAIVAPLIRSKDAETSYAIGTVALWGLVAIFIYPELGHLAHATDIAFGVFAGTAIHSTPQVVGAGFIFSDLAGQTATAVKLVRNCFMAPIAMAIAFWYARREGRASSEKVNIMKAFPWFLFGYFLMAFMSSKGWFTKSGVDGFSSIAKFLILVGMAGVGANTVLSAFKETGSKPLVVGLIGSVVVAVVSAAMISTLL